ncbi:MAG: pantoate--beta-alanine ligase [Bacteroidota bacterium]
MPEIIKRNAELKIRLDELRKNGKSIGFVPTLGALHMGHMSLINKALKWADIVVCSIFVNPTQFNEESDFDRYPRPIKEDIALLKKNNCHFLFLPFLEEIYPKNHKKFSMNIGNLGDTMEGANRPGHFEGVIEVVHRLLSIVEPDFAFFGEKDFQQLSIIRLLVQKARFTTQIVPCEIIREKDGLAMSSRNRLLTTSQRSHSPILYKTLKKMALNKQELSPFALKEHFLNYLKTNKVDVEYLEIAREDNLEAIRKWYKTIPCRIFIVARFGAIRLIDNISVAYRPK